MRLPPAVFFNSIAPDCLDVQSFSPDVGHLARRCAAPPTAAEVHLYVSCAYLAHAVIRSPAYEYAPMLDVINLLCLCLPTVFYFLLGCCSLENRKDQLSTPCLRLTKKVTK